MRGNRDKVLLGFALVLLVGGLLAAYLIIGLMGEGQMLVALIVLTGGVAVLASLASIGVALLCVLVLSFTDGFLKGLDSSGIAVFAKDIFLVIAVARWAWLNLSRGD